MLACSAFRYGNSQATEGSLLVALPDAASHFAVVWNVWARVELGLRG